MGYDLGIVTVTYNSAEVLDPFLASLKGQSLPAETHCLYLIDNASTDTTLQRVHTYEGNVVVHSNDENLGFAAGCNQGIKLALRDGCRYVLLLNNDTKFGSGFLDAMLAAARENHSGVLVPTIERSSPPETWYAGGRLRQWAGYQPRLYPKPAPADEAMVAGVEFASGCCLLLRSDVIDAVGLLDEDFFTYWEDVDYSLRLKEAGVRVHYAPFIVISHDVGRLTGGPRSAFSVLQRAKNQVLMIRKHAGPLKGVSGFLYIQLWTVARLFVGRDDLRTFRLRQRGYLIGMRVSLSKRA